MQRFLSRAILRRQFSFDSSHYLKHHSNVLMIIAVPFGNTAGEKHESE
jgi:6-pyruvoyl-tetrahydropterin synthase